MTISMAALLFLAVCTGTHAQMQMGGTPHTFEQEIRNHDTSGTAAEPNSVPQPMWMAMHGGWMMMFHGNAFVADIQQTSPRGGDKFFSTNWWMPMAQRAWGRSQLTVRAMLSMEPATITGRQYPLLFQQGETAYGNPIADGQHPHDFFMETAGIYDYSISSRTLVSFYLAPVGDPAIGPVAFPHRISALEDPVAVLGHHQEDSTHISDDVVTAGLAHGWARLEASGFHGREPSEQRWEIQQGAMDSWSLRLTLQPGQNWSGQVSYGRLHSPEALYPTGDQARTTGSILYNRPLRVGNWASSLVWGRTRSVPDGAIENSYLLESTLHFRRRNYAWTRIENVERTNELLLGERPLPLGFQEEPVGRVQAYTFGYDRDLPLLPHFATALGAQVTAYADCTRLQPIYGTDPMGVVVFLRVRPVGKAQ